MTHKTESARGLLSHVGRTGRLSLLKPRMVVDVTIVDARPSFGRIDYLVTPAAGAGEAWVDSTKVELDGG